MLLYCSAIKTESLQVYKWSGQRLTNSARINKTFIKRYRYKAIRYKYNNLLDHKLCYSIFTPIKESGRNISYKKAKTIIVTYL